MSSECIQDILNEFDWFSPNDIPLVQGYAQTKIYMERKTLKRNFIICPAMEFNIISASIGGIMSMWFGIQC